MIPVVIVTGFLGAGKTSFLGHFLQEVKVRQLRPALVINEVGSVDIDSELLKGLDIEQISLMGGCICCTLIADLIKNMWDIIDSGNYDMIIIECSGLSNPIDIVSAISSPAMLQEIYLSNIICLFDAGFTENVLSKSTIGKLQLDASDKVIINKTDKIHDEVLERISNEIVRLNENCEIFYSEYGLPRDNAIQYLLDKLERFSGKLDYDNSGAFIYINSFCTEAVSIDDCVYSKEGLFDALMAMPENVVRAKGFVKCSDNIFYSAQKSFDTVDIREYNYAAPDMGSILVFIGPRIWGKRIREILDSYKI